jgi:heterodisulfide reductase subunit A
VRIGVFVCHCGTNISSTVDVERVSRETAKIPRVVTSKDYKYMCSDPGQMMIADGIRKQNLDRIVVAACSPRLHERTFQKCLENNGLNPYLVEMANIREQCSWVHEDKEKATDKAIDIIRLLVAKVSKNKPLFRRQVPVEKKAIVIGGGIAGIQSAIDIGTAGYKVVLVEREPSIGGRMAQFDKTFPTLDCAACILTPKMVTVSQDPNIQIHTYAEIEEVSGYLGNFTVKIRKKARSVDMSKCTGCGICWQKCPARVSSEFDQGLGERKAIYVPFPQAVPNKPVIDRAICRYFTTGKCRVCEKLCSAGAIDYGQKDEIIEEKAGAIIVATGFELFDPSTYGEYGAGKYKNVITGLQFERMINSSGPTGGKIVRPSDKKEVESVVFIQCVGSRDEAKGLPYCSRVCCMYTAKHALLLKEHYPDAKAYVFYIDIRAGGKNYEEFVKRVQDEYKVLYLRGRVSKIFERNGRLVVRGADTLSGAGVEIETDLVVLANGLTPRKDVVRIAQLLGIPYDKNMFFTELHAKLAPAETVSNGIFLAGSCQFPKDIPDTVGTASAAAAKVLGLFTHDFLTTEPIAASVRERICNGCFDCKIVCAFKAIEETVTRDKRRVAKVIESVCHGCGVCVSTCRAGAIDLDGFTNEQILAEINAL